MKLVIKNEFEIFVTKIKTNIIIIPLVFQEMHVRIFYKKI